MRLADRSAAPALAMMMRALFAVLAVAVLGALLWVQQRDDSDSGSSDTAPADPGFIAVRARLVETGPDGMPLYRLDADRIEQPQPEGLIYLTAPKLNYQPTEGSPWTLSALRGEMPQDAGSAELQGNVHAEGKPGNSKQTMRIDAEQLHLDMKQQVATTQTGVRVQYSCYQLRARSMRADLKNDRLQMSGNGYATQRC